jgi:hypothetical protein
MPDLINLNAKRAEEVYEVNYRPKVEADGRIIGYSEAEKAEISQFLVTYFFESPKAPTLSIGRQVYLGGTEADLKPISREELEEATSFETTDSRFWNDLVVTDVSKSQVKKFIQEAQDIDFQMRFVSMKSRFQAEFSYYFGNFIFGLVVSTVFLSFSVLITYLLIASSLKIFKQDIRLFRIIGVSNQKLINNFSFLFAVPIVTILVLFVMFVYSTGLDFIMADYFYLSLINLALVLFVRLTVKRKVKRELNA